MVKSAKNAHVCTFWDEDSFLLCIRNVTVYC